MGFTTPLSCLFANKMFIILNNFLDDGMRIFSLQLKHQWLVSVDRVTHRHIINYNIISLIWYNIWGTGLAYSGSKAEDRSPEVERPEKSNVRQAVLSVTPSSLRKLKLSSELPILAYLLTNAVDLIFQVGLRITNSCPSSKLL